MVNLQILEMDHIVLNVSDVERSLAFYTDVLGLKGERIEEFRKGEVGFPSVRINADTIIDLSPQPGPFSEIGRNLNHFCLVVQALDLSLLAEQLQGQGVSVQRGPASRWGARGRGTSVYILDPDGNEIEIRHY